MGISMHYTNQVIWWQEKNECNYRYKKRLAAQGGLSLTKDQGQLSMTEINSGQLSLDK